MYCFGACSTGVSVMLMISGISFSGVVSLVGIDIVAE